MEANMYQTIKQFIKYGFVGACGTCAHYCWLIALSFLCPKINPAYFAFSGALLGAIINYLLNYHYTFTSSKKHFMAFPQFAMLAVFNMLASFLIVQAFTAFNLHFLPGQIIATMLCVPFGFIISKKVVFNEQ